jgi:hypothetical protein
VQDLLEAIFFSPSFLYRQPSNAATTLSYLATLGPPDDTLLDAPLSDPEERVRQLRRLVQTPAGQHALAVLVLEWLGSNEPTLHTKSPSYLAGLPAGFEGQVRTSAEATIGAVLSGGAPTLSNLFSTTAYAFPELDSGGFMRSGLLMHPQVLSAHTKEDGFSPFRLGVFLREDLLCQSVPPPPADAQTKALPDVPGLSVRDEFQHKISAGAACLACHSTFAPLGYSFLPFDPAGRWTPKDPTGVAWDLTGSIPTFSGTLSFSSPADLEQQLGASPQVQGCFAQNALEWTKGRELVTDDLPSVLALNAAVKHSGGDVMAVLETIVRDPDFAKEATP